jgi:hypothetical protein
MNRRNLVAAVGLCVVALLVAVALYVGNLQAAEPTASKKAPAAQSAAEQIKQLQTQIASLERRIAALENRPTPVLLSPAAGPQFNFSAPSPNGLPDGSPNDGFPPARILLINGNPAVTNGRPAR